VTDHRARLRFRLRRRGLAHAAGVVAIAVGLAGCSASTTATSAGGSTAADGRLPVTHIHGVGTDAEDGALYLATHDGLFEVGEDGRSTRIGPVIDLMGFAVSGPDHFLASGHPGPGVDLPQPVGLIESTDGGATWVPVSRQGISDFHTLTSSNRGVLGYDGSLWRSTNGKEWEQLVIPSPPATLATSPDGQLVLATTEPGLLRSTDGGSSWSQVQSAPLLQVVDWAPDGAGLVGVTPGGELWTSADSGETWQEGPRLGSAPQAVDVSGSGEAARVVVVTTEALLESTDGGRTFDILLGD
jgi:hypothetical protein